MRRCEAKQYFTDLGIEYEDISIHDLLVLSRKINAEFENSYSSYICSTEIRTDLKRKKNVTHGISYAYFYCYKDYKEFKECISFQEDKFIGFCWWADDKIKSSVLQGFVNWCDYMAEKKNDGIEV